MGRRNSTRIDQGRKDSRLLVVKMQGTNRSGEGGRRACYVTPDLEVRLGGREKRRARIINGMENEIEHIFYTIVCVF